jgi:7-cyano-7-deazaguanine synthase
MKKAVLSLSGGMDSTSLLIHLLANDYEVKVYSFDYGQKHRVELERAWRNIQYLRSQGFLIAYQVIDLKSVFNESKSALTSTTKVPEGHYAEENMKATVVENRNAIFASIIFSKALSWANETKKDVKICLAIHSGDHAIYPDCRPEFRDALNHAFKIGNWNSERVDFYLPYIEGNKKSILEDCSDCCVRLDLDFSLIMRDTNTCYNPDEQGRSCGKCGSCVERVEAFIHAGLQDPITYQEPWKVIKDNVISVLNKKN